MQQDSSGEPEWLWRLAQTLFSGAAEGVALVSAETGQLLALNRAAARLLGLDWQPEHPLAQLPAGRRRVAPGPLPAALAPLLQLPSGAAKTPLEFDLPAPLGSAATLRAVIYPLEGAEPAAQVVFLQTQVPAEWVRAELEAALIMLRETQQALVNLPPVAASPSDMGGLETRLGKLRHDLRNYINVIGGYAEVLQARVKDKRQRENAELIYEAAQEANQLITLQLRALPEGATGALAGSGATELAQRLQKVAARLETLQQAIGR